MHKSLQRILSVALLLGCSSQATAWTYQSTMEGMSVGQQCGWADGKASIVTQERAIEGSNSCKLSVNAGDTGFGSWGGVIYTPTTVGRYGEIWFRVRTFFPIGFDYNSYGEGNRLKFLRIHTMSPSSDNSGYADWYFVPASSGIDSPFSFIYEGEQVWSEFGSRANDSIALGVWETYEIYMKLDTVPRAKGGQARVRVWKNGKLMKDINDRVTLRTADAYVDRVHLFTYWNGGSPLSQSMYVDDVVVASTTPQDRDSDGFPFVGVGASQTAPNPPAGVVVE